MINLGAKNGPVGKNGLMNWTISEEDAHCLRFPVLVILTFFSLFQSMTLYIITSTQHNVLNG